MIIAFRDGDPLEGFVYVVAAQDGPDAGGYFSIRMENMVLKPDAVTFDMHMPGGEKEPHTLYFAFGRTGTTSTGVWKATQEHIDFAPGAFKPERPFAMPAAND